MLKLKENTEFDIIGLGEVMLRLSAPNKEKISQCEVFEKEAAGTELNVASGAAMLGARSALLTKLPSSKMGHFIRNRIRYGDVSDDYIVYDDSPTKRLGIYYSETGAYPRKSAVIYDRAGSSIALAKADEYDWNKIFEGADWFHWTGITPALSDDCAEACLAACRAAKERGITISCDLNYRKKLWSREKAGEVMGRLMPYVDVCIANEEDAKDVFGIASMGTDIEGGKLNRDGYVDVARQICERFR